MEDIGMGGGGSGMGMRVGGGMQGGGGGRGRGGGGGEARQGKTRRGSTPLHSTPLHMEKNMAGNSTSLVLVSVIPISHIEKLLGQIRSTQILFVEKTTVRTSQIRSRHAALVTAGVSHARCSREVG